MQTEGTTSTRYYHHRFPWHFLGQQPTGSFTGALSTVSGNNNKLNYSLSTPSDVRVVRAKTDGQAGVAIGRTLSNAGVRPVANTVQLSSLQDGICALGKTLAPTSFGETLAPISLGKTLVPISQMFCPALPLKQFHCSSRPFKEYRPSISLSRLSLPGDQWCDVLGSVPAGSVSSSFTLQKFRDAIKPLWLLFPDSLSARSFPVIPARPGQYIH